jgi:catechol 2,3-dioxygenase-like lactoylglutathione lyase family enzyme
MFAIDHIAFPCFDIPATLRFYTEVLGGVLRHAQAGPAAVWNAKEYLLLTFDLPGGAVIDFFSFDGISARRGGDELPKDVRHLALSVATRTEVARLKGRFAEAEVPFWLEVHDVDDLHVYATDPNGVTLEILAKEDGVRQRKRDPADAQRIVAEWVAARS